MLTGQGDRPDLPAYGVARLSWFDVENVENGITLVRKGEHGPFVAIDTRREILYCWWTD